MLFSSITFIYFFLPLVLGVYYLLPKSMRNGWLLIASFFFYAWGEPYYLCIMVLTIVINYVAAIVVSVAPQKFKLLSVFIAIIVNLSILGYFK